MMKLFSLLLIALSLISCGKKSSSSSPVKSDLAVTDDYYPQGLDDKIIIKGSEKHAPMNFITQDLSMVFDVAAGTMLGHSIITFKLKHAGKPYFELQGTLKNIKVNDESTTVTSITDPDGQSQSYWSVNKTLSNDDTHVLEFDYTLPSSRFTYTGGGVRFLTDMTDLSGRFFEYWGPCGFEEDAFSMNLNIQVKNGTSSHTLRSNGNTTSTGSSSWRIVFPNYYSKSSFYVHLTNQTTLASKTFVYKGIAKDIPVEVYGVTQALVDSAVSQLPGLFKELESDYGAYPHDKFLAYMNDRSGGMEYVGATITSLGSLDHELLHSWFARSVIPADGRSGWIDESIASWRDYGYKRATATLNRTPTNLANYSPFRKTTPSNSYVDGRGLMSELDLEFSKQGGLKIILRAFFERYKNSVVTNEEFWNFLELYTGRDLSAFSNRYALGSVNGLAAKSLSVESAIMPEESKHPTPLTTEEIARLR